MMAYRSKVANGRRYLWQKEKERERCTARDRKHAPKTLDNQHRQEFIL